MKLSFTEYLILPINLIFLFFQLRTIDFSLSYFNFLFIDLLLPYIIIINLFFFFFWILRSKWPFLLFLPFLFFYGEWSRVYKLPETVIRNSNELIKVMSYNVRLFNKYDWIKDINVPKKILNFISNEDPDIISFQEYSINDSPNFLEYPYKFVKKTKLNGSVGLAIFSKFKIIDKGYLQFDNSNNGGIFIDVIIKKDTIRVYNIHLESLRFNINDSGDLKNNSNNYFLKLNQVFNKQIDQSKLFQKIDGDNNYPSIVCSDLNNSQFSEVYKRIKGSKIDSFEEEGEGFGGTFDIFIFPFRIDFIFVDNRFKLYKYKTYDKINFSDHKPISVKLNF
tara:strand:+ start:1658 stop:2662 length:1005 start_codon:yes stop_codon:yes gene_type:complete